MKQRAITTRSYEIKEVDEDGNEVWGIERREIDEALTMLAYSLFAKSEYSGKIETVWLSGGMREPQIPGWSKSWSGKSMKKLLPDMYTGRAVWHLNKGELSGTPVLSR